MQLAQLSAAGPTPGQSVVFAGGWQHGRDICDLFSSLNSCTRLPGPEPALRAASLQPPRGNGKAATGLEEEAARAICFHFKPKLKPHT